jgi:site-specific recombinase XerD
MAQMSPLRRRMIEDMTLRNLSRRTQQSYIYAVAKFRRHFNRSPDRLGLEDVRAYQLHLIGEKSSWSHINQVACALRFFYGITLDQKKAFERIVTATESPRMEPHGRRRGLCSSRAAPSCLALHCSGALPKLSCSEPI